MHLNSKVHGNIKYNYKFTDLQIKAYSSPSIVKFSFVT